MPFGAPAATAQVSGQTAPAAASTGADDVDAPGTILVVAQKRREDAKNVPLSISVIGGRELEDRKIRNFEDIARAVPGIGVYNTGGGNLSRVFIRGISSTQGTATVAVYVDDVTLTTPNLFFTGATLPRLFDLDHVEVSRGPQGTLFGASALGGALRFITNRPKLDRVEGDVSTEVSGTERAGVNYQLQGVVNLPLVNDKLALRIAVQNAFQSGFVDRVDGQGFVHAGVDRERATAARGSLLFQPTDGLTIEPSLLWQRTKADGTSIFFLALPPYRQSKLSPEPNSDELIVPSLTVRKDLGGLNLVSVTSYLHRTNRRQFDGQIYSSQSVAAALDPARGTNYAAIAGLPGPYTNDVYVRQWTQELRIGTRSIKETGHPYEAQAGLYFSDQKVGTYDLEYVNGLGDAIRRLYNVDPATKLGAPLVSDLLGNFYYATTRREYAVFGEGSYQLLSRLKATVGLRQSFSRIHYETTESGYKALGTPAALQRDGTDNPLTPKFALDYEASRQASFYANVSKGYRLGGSNNPLPTACAASLAAFGVNGTGTYQPDSLWSYEGGAKLRLFNNRLTTNASGYYIDWNNIQQSVTLPSCGYVTTVNAGSARSYGGELEISARLTHDLTLGFSGSLVDAKIANAATGSGTTNGQSLLHIPTHSFVGSVDYEHSFPSDVSAYLHLDADFLGHSHGSFATSNPDYFRPAYTVVNGNVGVRIGSFETRLFVQNLLNEDTIIQRPIVVSVRQGLTIRPRTIGLSGRYHF